MHKFLILGYSDPYTLEAETWEEAFWMAWDRCKDGLVSITMISETD